ncbi:lipocalin family protein [Bizionia arctica]|uniref:Lipocalin-like domain-containing protein n=1 Tax=Bizionia arctica TaxID=1495645 RepID=A0A917LM26_9FLAO|nr:lipocalin family protein [Bizionia arctica]GGG43614.1 hypothetical protein GCM10010976_13910 [Bizionia arctica]
MFNLKSIFALFFVLTIVVSCKNEHESQTNQKEIEQESTFNSDFLIGSWEDQSEAALDFSLFLDGTAKSDNMKSLLYQNWYVKNNQLYLTAKSMGNGSSSLDTEIYDVQELDENHMVLKGGEMIFEYKKSSKSNEGIPVGADETLPEQKSKILKGKLTLGHEAKSFEPCGSDKVFWVSDKTMELEKVYNDLTEGKKPYTPIFTEIEVIDMGKSVDGFPADYNSTYEVINILEARMVSDKDCE